MKKILVFIYVLLVIVFLKFVIIFSINEIFINKYENGDYDRNLVKNLFVLNISEPYIAYYNYGNVLYQIGYYEDAIKEFNKALEKNPSEERVCSIRINLSLSMINTITDDMECEEKYEILANARNVLYLDNCASESDDSGKSSIAEELEEEIKELEATTKASCESGSNGGNDNGDEDDNDDGEKSEEEKKSEELEERNKEASEKRQEELDRMEGYDNYSYYKGKKW